MDASASDHTMTTLAAWAAEHYTPQTRRIGSKPRTTWEVDGSSSALAAIDHLRQLEEQSAAVAREEADLRAQLDQLELLLAMRSNRSDLDELAAQADEAAHLQQLRRVEECGAAAVRMADQLEPTLRAIEATANHVAEALREAADLQRNEHARLGTAAGELQSAAWGWGNSLRSAIDDLQTAASEIQSAAYEMRYSD